MAKNKFAKLIVAITIKHPEGSDKAANKLKKRLAKVMQKRHMQLFGIGVESLPEKPWTPAVPPNKSILTRQPSHSKMKAKPQLHPM